MGSDLSALQGGKKKKEKKIFLKKIK